MTGALLVAAALTTAGWGPVRVGDGEEAALRTYAGRSQVLPHKYSDTGKYIVVATSDGKRAVVVETDQGRVTQIRGGQRPAVEYVEGCS